MNVLNRVVAIAAVSIPATALLQSRPTAPSAVPVGYSILGDRNVVPIGFEANGILSNRELPQERAPFPYSLVNTAATAFSDLAYVMGGALYDGSGRYIGANQVWAFDPSANLWTRKSDLPTDVQGGRAATANGRIYLLGGASASWTNEVREYDPLTDSWSAKSPLPTTLFYFSLEMIADRIYLVGGMNPMGALNPISYEFDPITDSWRTIASMPTMRYQAASIVADDKLIVLGGSTSIGASPVVESYDPVADRWSTLPPLPRARYDARAEYVNGHVLGDRNSKRMTSAGSGRRRPR